MKVEAFVRTDDDCKQTCSDNNLCGYYKHFPSEDEKQPLVIFLNFFVVKLYTNFENMTRLANYKINEAIVEYIDRVRLKP